MIATQGSKNPKMNKNFFGEVPFFLKTYLLEVLKNTHKIRNTGFMCCLLVKTFSCHCFFSSFIFVVKNTINHSSLGKYFTFLYTIKTIDLNNKNLNKDFIKEFNKTIGNNNSKDETIRYFCDLDIEKKKNLINQMTKINNYI